MTFTERLIRRKFLLFLLLSLLLYGNTLKNGYAIDDQFVTENNMTTQGLKSVKTIFTSYYADDGRNTYEYRPFVKLSFAIEHQFFGVHPWVGHLINIVLYALCLFLLHKVLLTVFHTQPPLFSLCVALVFAFVPVHTEVVASLKNRDVLLCFIFCMSVMLNIDAFLRTTNYRYAAYAFFFALVGFLTKVDLLPYLVIAPLVYYKKYNFKLKPLLVLIPVLIFALSFLASKKIKHLFLENGIGERVYTYSENPLFFDHSFDLKISTAFNVLGHYLKMLVLPTKMVCYYGYNTLPVSDKFSVFSLLGIILFGLMVFYFFKLFKTNNPFWYAIVFFAIPVSMYLNIVKVVPGIVAERFLFFASLGFSIFITQLLFSGFNKSHVATSSLNLNTAFKAVFAVMLLVNSVFVFSRNAEWKDRITLYEHDVKKRPESIPLNMLYSMEILSNLNRPNYFLTEQNTMNYVNKAEVSLNNIVKIDPDNVTALHNLAFIRQNVYKDYAGAVPYYEKALKQDSTKFESRFNLAYCYYNIGRGKEAEALVLKIYPQHSGNQQVLDLLSYILVENKKSHEGIILFDELAKKHPENNMINMILGNFYISLSDTLNAKKAYLKASQNDPGNEQLFKIIDKLSE